MADIPILRVVKGDASAEEIAALVAALAVTAGARNDVSAEQTRPLVRDDWNDKTRLMRQPVHPSAGGWRRSALP